MRFVLAFLLVSGLFSAANNPVAFKIFTSNGKESSFGEMVKTCSKADVVLFGELHNNAICHWLELEMCNALYEEKSNNLVLAAEMFERDNQLLIDEYLSNKIATRNFEEEAKMWNNYKTDYKPLMEFAKEKQIPMVAANIPRRYASMVAKSGLTSLDGLSDQARELMAYPFQMDENLPGYAALKEMGMGGHGDPVNLMNAQAIKDATMAQSIAKRLTKDVLVLHFNGAYHSANHEGIEWHLGKYAPQAKVKTIACVEQDDTESIENEYIDQADFIIVIKSNITKTY